MSPQAQCSHFMTSVFDLFFEPCTLLLNDYHYKVPVDMDPISPHIIEMYGGTLLKTNTNFYKGFDFMKALW